MTIKGKATSLDIAYLAGVSQPTVSRALRGSALGDGETGQAIRGIAVVRNENVDKHAHSPRLRIARQRHRSFSDDPS
ncbi:LacI family transcriptional regulator, partial [Xanthomonas euvesicatoria]|nr:LacI family transcriptional regulator [Xanthomonas euvesicatoria]